MNRLFIIVATVAIVAGCAYAQNNTEMPTMQNGGSMSMDMTVSDSTVPDSCVTDPTQANCTDYAYPEANAAADLVVLCKAMPFMVACSVAKACNESAAGAANVSEADPNICAPFQHVATVCRPRENMMRMKGCVNYNPMCANGSKVEQCTQMPGVEAIPTTKIVNDRVRAVCESMPHSGCELCLPSWEKNQTWGNCDLLDVYGSVCSEMPDMKECAEFQEMCQQDGTLWVCKKYPSAIVEGTAGTNATRSSDAAKSATANATQTAAKATSAASTAAVNVVFLIVSAASMFAMFYMDW